MSQTDEEIYMSETDEEAGNNALKLVKTMTYNMPFKPKYSHIIAG